MVCVYVYIVLGVEEVCRFIGLVEGRVGRMWEEGYSFCLYLGCKRFKECLELIFIFLNYEL